MKTIKELILKYVNSGYSIATSRNLSAEEIILKKISESDMTDKIALKGGIVLFNLTHNARRATRDIDFDFIRYSIDENSIRLFIKKLNQNNDGFKVEIQGAIKQLHQEDYQGVRIHIVITDVDKDALNLKMDVGVHAYLDIEQQNISFSFAENKKEVLLQVNPPEQIFAEKMMSLARLGPISTRYKDIYDMYYLTTLSSFNKSKLKTVFSCFFMKSKREPHDFVSLIERITLTLENAMFKRESENISNKWLDVDYEEVKRVLLITLEDLLIIN
jgi:predicted nucleotidyltransferase component of viral defense system